MSEDRRVPANKFIDPFTDYGFKKLFGEESSIDLLIDFLNSLLEGKEKIKSLTYKDKEKLGRVVGDRTAIYDLYCENEEGEKFIVELQKNKQDYFRERAVYYSTFPIQEQAERGNWNFQLKAVYLIGILDFVFEEDKDSPNHIQYIKLKNDRTNNIYYDKLTYIFMEMPKFNKEEHELVTNADKWSYIFKSLPYLEDRPDTLKEKVFDDLFEKASLARMSHAEHLTYERSLKYYRDAINTMDYAKREAREEGLEEGMEKGLEEGMEKGREEGELKKQKEIAINLKKVGLETSKISQTTGLSIEEIEKL